MSKSSDSSDTLSSLPKEIRLKIEAVCKHFERALQANKKPRIERYLEKKSELPRGHLLRELLVLEVQYLAKTGQEPTIELYLNRFPDDLSVVQKSFMIASPALPFDDLETPEKKERTASSSNRPRKSEDKKRPKERTHTVAKNKKRTANPKPVPRLKRIKRWCKENRVVTGLVASVTILLLIILIINLSKTDSKTGNSALLASKTDGKPEKRAAKIHGKQPTSTPQNPKNIATSPTVTSPSLTLTGHRSIVMSVAYSPDGKRIVSSSYSTVKIWDAETGRELRTLEGHKNSVRSVSFSPDGKRIVSGGHQTVKIWDAETGRELRTLTGHKGFVLSVSFSPDGKRIFSGDNISIIKIWDAETGRELRTLTGDKSSVSGVSFSPDGKRIISGGYKTLKIWDVKTGRELHRLTGHTSDVSGVSFSPDGKQIVSSSYSTVKIWDAETGRELRTLEGHKNSVLSVSYSPDGKRIISGGSKTVKIWDAETGRELRTLTGHKGAVYGVSFSPDSKQIVSGGKDRTVKIWDVATD